MPVSTTTRLLARILKVGVQILCGPSAHIEWRLRRYAPRGVWWHARPENFEKLKPLRRDFRDSYSCKLPQRSLTHILINNHQRAYLFIAAGKVGEDLVSQYH